MSRRIEPAGLAFIRSWSPRGVNPEDVRFGELGYAREARASYLDFVAARDNGVLSARRTQICAATSFLALWRSNSPFSKPPIRPEFLLRSSGTAQAG